MAQRGSDHQPLAGPRTSLPPGFVLVALGRFVSNVAFRLVFPFLPRIAAGLGVSLGAMGTSLAVRDLAGIASPHLGRAVDRNGHARSMSIAFGVFAAALLLQATSTGLAMFTVALVGVSLAKLVFDAGSSAWVGDAVPYAKRGRAMGAIETTWAVSFIIAMPLAALVIRATTWRTPFVVAAGLCIIAGAATHGLMASGTISAQAGRAVTWSPALRAGVWAITWIGVGHSMMLVTYATWLEDEHALSVSGLGLTAVVIGFAELAGSGGSAALSDRIGLGRGLRVALLLAIPLSALVALGSISLPLALLFMAAFFVVVEFAVVALISLFTELDPDARGTAMGWAFAGFTIGHAAGAVLGAQLYVRSGMTMNAFVMGAVFAAAFAAVQGGPVEHHSPGAQAVGP